MKDMYDSGVKVRPIGIFRVSEADLTGNPNDKMDQNYIAAVYAQPVPETPAMERHFITNNPEDLKQRGNPDLLPLRMELIKTGDDVGLGLVMREGIPGYRSNGRRRTVHPGIPAAAPVPT